MKKKLLFLITVIATVCFYSCDYHQKYFEMDEINQDTETAKYTYTITANDITTIVKALYANKSPKDSTIAKSLNKDGAFSVNAPAAVCIPYLLKTKYIGANKGTSADIAYSNKSGSASYYTLTAKDYFEVWNNNTVNALTPAHAPATVIPALLKRKYPAATEGDIRMVEYQFSSVEPTAATVTVDAFSDDFEAYTAGNEIAVPTDKLFVVNKDLTGTFTWQCRTFNNNKYAQVTANKSTTDNEIWLITKQIDLTEAAENTSFGFDITAGYYNADCLSIQLSTNFDGKESGIGTATWTNITSNFTLPTGPSTGYGILSPAGQMDLKAYAGKKVHIAFKYAGSGVSNPKKTTTFQVDNIKVSYEKVATSVPTPITQFGYYIFRNGVWTLETKSFYPLTSQDYVDMGVNALSLTTAQNYIPILLKSKFPYAQNDSKKVVVFKTSATANNADEYVLSNGVWSPILLVSEKTDQFIFTGWDVSGWVFDPTLYVTMKKGKAETDDYMMVVNYVKSKYAVQTPTLVNTQGDAEYYYGFSAYYGNISLRESDRMKDPAYAELTSKEDKEKLLEVRTSEGLAVYLTLKYPDAQPQVSGIDVFAVVTTAIYDGVSTYNYVYKFQRVDAEPKWKFIERTKL